MSPTKELWLLQGSSWLLAVAIGCGGAQPVSPAGDNEDDPAPIGGDDATGDDETAGDGDSTGTDDASTDDGEPCEPTEITPFLRVDSGAWQATSDVEIPNGSTVRLGPHPEEGGSWQWTGCGTSGSTREQTLSPSSTCEATARFTSACGAQSELTFTITVSGRFRHPGVLANRAQLDFVKAKIAAGAEPWSSAFEKARDDDHGSLSWTPRPRAIVECGSSSNPNNGCTDERGDAMAAYTHALLWYFTDEQAHADKAIEIMNAWAGTITDHTNHNAPLQTGWSGSMWAPAAELIRYTAAGWSDDDFARFQTMLRDVYRPKLFGGSCANGNWELIMTNALFGIAVVLDDEEAFDKALELWRGRVPAYIYMSSDGDEPRKPGHCNRPNWYGQDTLVDGVGQETCRDFGHMEWGIIAAIDAAETAYQQGTDLYAEESARLRAGLEFHAEYDLGAAVPSWLCGGSISTANTPAWEIAYNHFVGRMGDALPNSARMIERVRPTGNNYFIAWETLTHAETGTLGF